MDIHQVSTEYDLLVGSVYQGPLETAPWQSFLELLREEMNAAAVSLVLRPPSSDDLGLVLYLGGTTHWADAYRENYFAVDPFVDLPEGQVVTLQEFLPGETLEQSDYYQQFLKPSGIYYMMGADTRIPNGMQARLRICRTRGQQPFNDEEMTTCARLVPHLTRAIELHSRLAHTESERALYANAMEQLSLGIIILNDSGQVLRSNPVAKALVDAKDGLKVVDGQLHVGSRDDNRQLRELIQQTLNSNQEPSLVRAMRVERLTSSTHLGLLIRPVPNVEWTDGANGPAVALFISDPDRRSQAPQKVVQQLFELTPAEAALATLLAQGLALDEASAELGITRNTARAQLRSVFSKAGVTRQADLVRLILNSVATLG